MNIVADPTTALLAHSGGVYHHASIPVFNYPPTHTFRISLAADATTVQNIWIASQDSDSLAFRPRGGWWSLADWATASYLLLEDGRPVGVAALNFGPDTVEAAEARLALHPSHRSPVAAEYLVDAAVALTLASGAPKLHLYLPEQATWAGKAAKAQGFSPFRALHVMLRSAAEPPLPVPAINGVRIRPLREGEAPQLLAALNRAWTGSWNFHPLTLEMLAVDLAGQQEGFLVAAEAADDTHIIGTIQPLFDLASQNPDGAPYAWLSNLTTDPDWRGRGLGRALLAAGLESLRLRGARSVALGVDGGNPAPVTLYRSTGFVSISTVDIWKNEPFKSWIGYK